LSARRAPPELIALAGLAAVQIALALAWVAPGPLSIDEVLYQTMARSAAEGSALTVANGYEELPSRELATVDYMLTTGGRLTVQYPALFPLLAGPLYRTTGLIGAFLLNAVAFAGVLVFTWRIGARLFGYRVALLGALVLAAGTFAWDYAMAAWPHMLTLLLELAAFDLVIAAALDERYEARPLPGLIAGIMLGLAVGFRRDAVFFLPVAALPLLFASPPRIRSLVALAVGAAPPLLLVGWLNWLRWGTWSPIAYGQGGGPAEYRLLGLIGALGLVAVVTLALPPVRRRALDALRARPRAFVLAAALGALALLALPPTRFYALRAVDGMEALLLDLRGSATEMAGTQLYYFAVLYAGGLKKSLLQSLPWLPLLLVCGALAWRDRAQRRAVLLLLLPVAVYVGIQVFLNRHGGMSLNMRYFLPALPSLALLGALALDAVWRSADEAGAPSGSRMISVAVPMVGALLLWSALRPSGFAQPRDAVHAALNAPLLLALLVAGAAVFWITRPGRAAALALLGVSGAALAWSACLAFDYDARWSRAVRAANLAQATTVAASVPPGALLFGELPDWDGLVPALVDGVIVAYPNVDGFEDFHRLAVHHLRAGRPVFAALDPRRWQTLEDEGRLEGLEFRRAAGGPRPVLELRRAPQ
jgi:4-amino-4-deoxy-L-arabinose transferase-like glycosyltransferase